MSHEEMKRNIVTALVPVSSAALAVPAFAEGSTVVTASDWASVISSLTAQISVSTVVGVLATTVAAGVGLVFMWWGVRKAIRTIMAAFRKGRMSA